MFGMRSTWKTGLLALAGLMLTVNVARAWPLGLGLRLRPAVVVPYGVGYYYPGYYPGPFAYSFYGPGYGFSIRYGIYAAPPMGGFGVGLGRGFGMAGLPPLGGAGLGAGPALPGNALPQRGQPAQVQQEAPPQRARPGQIPRPTPVPRDEQEDKAPDEDNTARVTVVVPEGAELWFNDTKTNQRGPRREFATEPLEPGQDYRYRIKARWMEDGKPVEITQTVKVRANSAQTVDFTKIRRAPAPE